MPEKLFTVEDVNHLLEQNSMPPYGPRNAALIMGAVYWGLTPLELSLIAVEDVIAPGGELYLEWFVPEHFACNGIARKLRTENHVLPFFERYVKYRKEKGWGLSNLNTHCGLSPKSCFFLNDRGQEYKLVERNNKPGSFEPRRMNDQLKRMIDRSGLNGATPRSFRDSFIKGMYEAGAGWSDLISVTGIKHKKTLEKKVRPHEKELIDVLKTLYGRVKMPEHLLD